VTSRVLDRDDQPRTVKAGRIRRWTEAARAQFVASHDVRRGVMLFLVSDVAAGYFRLLEFDREREIARSILS
jgi:multidrug efflux system outer membrane protein